MGMNPLDFLNSFLDNVNYGIKGVQEGAKESLDNYLVAKREEEEKAALEEYRRKRREKFLNHPNENVRWHAQNPTYSPVRLNAQYPTYGPSMREQVEKIARHWGVRNPTLPDYVRDFPPEVQRFAETFAPLPPEIPDHIRDARWDPKYQKWLASSKKFTLGGRQYKWVETPIEHIPKELLSIPLTKSRNYRSLLSDLISHKRWASGNAKYIPVPAEPFK